MSTSQSVRALLQSASDAAQKKQWEQACSLLEQVLASEPDNLMALDLFGFVRFFQGRPDLAETYCRKALSLEPEHAYALKGLGLCLARQGKVEEGVLSLQKAITLSPNWADPYWDLAIVLTENKRYEQALEVLAEGLKKVPQRRADFQTFVARLQKLQGLAASH